MVYLRPVTTVVILIIVAAVLGNGHAADTELRNQALSVFRPLAVDGSSTADPLAAGRVALGRVLYFEPRISADGTISCARCHQPSLYGTDGLPRSIGAEHRVHPRHAPTVLNAALQFVQHWRGDRTSVEDQAMQALVAPPSYGNPSYDSAIAKIKAIPAYTTLFAQAFPGQDDPVTPQNWGQAIGAYVRTLLTPAPFDRFLAGDDVAISASARSGLRTFVRVGCAACHNGAGVGGMMYQKFGLREEYWTATGSRVIDKGRFEVTKDPADMYVFKVPMLRNVAMTAPYFHDGSVATLRDAVRIMGRVQLGLALTEREVVDVVAFLESLTGPLPDNFTSAPTLPIAAPR